MIALASQSETRLKLIAAALAGRFSSPEWKLLKLMDLEFANSISSAEGSGYF
jgi:hypothetical protein